MKEPKVGDIWRYKNDKRVKARISGNVNGIVIFDSDFQSGSWLTLSVFIDMYEFDGEE